MEAQEREVELVTFDGMSAFCRAVQHQSLDVAQSLFESESISPEEMAKALLIAVSHPERSARCLEMINFLIKTGDAKVNVELLHLAAMTGNTPVVECLRTNISPDDQQLLRDADAAKEVAAQVEEQNKGENQNAIDLLLAECAKPKIDKVVVKRHLTKHFSMVFQWCMVKRLSVSLKMLEAHFSYSEIKTMLSGMHPTILLSYNDGFHNRKIKDALFDLCVENNVLKDFCQVVGFNLKKTVEAFKLSQLLDVYSFIRSGDYANALLSCGFRSVYNDHVFAYLGKAAKLQLCDAPGELCVGDRKLTALHIAAIRGDFEGAKLLMQWNVGSPLVEDTKGMRPSDLASTPQIKKLFQDEEAAFRATRTPTMCLLLTRNVKAVSEFILNCLKTATWEKGLGLSGEEQFEAFGTINNYFSDEEAEDILSKSDAEGYTLLYYFKQTSDQHFRKIKRIADALLPQIAEMSPDDNFMSLIKRGYSADTLVNVERLRIPLLAGALKRMDFAQAESLIKHGAKIALNVISISCSGASSYDFVDKHFDKIDFKHILSGGEGWFNSTVLVLLEDHANRVVNLAELLRPNLVYLDAHVTLKSFRSIYAEVVKLCEENDKALCQAAIDGSLVDVERIVKLGVSAKASMAAIKLSRSTEVREFLAKQPVNRLSKLFGVASQCKNEEVKLIAWLSSRVNTLKPNEAIKARRLYLLAADLAQKMAEPDSDDEYKALPFKAV